MNNLHSVFHLVLADFRDRVRRFNFLVLVMATAYLGYLFVPPVEANYQTLSFGDIRGFYNSPWVGAMFGIMISTLSSMIVFFPLKNAVERDRQTRVGQIIAATPTRKPAYVLGKWLSNLALLTVLSAVMTMTAAVMQLVRAEDTVLDLWALGVPLWLIGFPTLALVAAIAVLFECIPFLRGAWGSIAYFAVYMTVLVWTMEGLMGISNDYVTPSADPFGISHVLSDMQQVVKQYDPDYSGNLIIGGAESTQPLILFPWTGMHWAELLPGRLQWMGVAVLLAVSAALPFDRFDPAKQRISKRRQKRLKRQDTGTVSSANTTLAQIEPATLTPLSKYTNRGRAIGVLVAELRLALKGLPWWWYLAMLALIVTQGIFDLEISSKLLLGAWLLPVSIWSAMGTRETRHQSKAMIFSVAHPIRRQFFAIWLTGVIVALLASSTTLIRLLVAGEPGRWSAVLVGALFVPSMALAMGVWSGTPRLFEATYFILWYIAFNGLDILDFTGTVMISWQPEITMIYAGISGLLFICALLGRWRQLRR